MNDVEVIAGSRLHFGLLCAPDGGRWNYGGIGMMLDQPHWHFHFGLNLPNTTDSIVASPDVTGRLERILVSFRQIHTELPAIRITTQSEASLHAGLGAGTQLTLAAVSAMRLLLGQSRPTDVGQIAETFGRSRRSAVGTFGFDHGGFIVDFGRSMREGNQIKRFRFPDKWRMVLLTPRASAGLFGDTEESFFGKQDTLDGNIIQRLETIIEDELIVALTQEDLSRFADSLAAYGNLAGEFYASAQGGIFSSALLRPVVAWLENRGIHGAVQSSWGPTICIPAASELDAASVRDTVLKHPAANQIDITIAKGLNTGTTIKTLAPENQRSLG